MNRLCLVLVMLVGISPSVSHAEVERFFDRGDATRNTSNPTRDDRTGGSDLSGGYSYRENGKDRRDTYRFGGGTSSSGSSRNKNTEGNYTGGSSAATDYSDYRTADNSYGFPDLITPPSFGGWQAYGKEHVIYDGTDKEDVRILISGLPSGNGVRLDFWTGSGAVSSNSVTPWFYLEGTSGASWARMVGRQKIVNATGRRGSVAFYELRNAGVLRQLTLDFSKPDGRSRVRVVWIGKTDWREMIPVPYTLTVVNKGE